MKTSREPSPSNCFRMFAWKPSTTATINNMELTPMITPSIVRKLRSLFARMLPRAWRIPSSGFISPWGRPACPGPPAGTAGAGGDGRPPPCPPAARRATHLDPGRLTAAQAADVDCFPLYAPLHPAGVGVLHHRRAGEKGLDAAGDQLAD